MRREILNAIRAWVGSCFSVGAVYQHSVSLWPLPCLDYSPLGVHFRSRFGVTFLVRSAVRKERADRWTAVGSVYT